MVNKKSPKLPSQSNSEAIEPIRGFTAQFAATAVSILEGNREEQTYVEVFEDLLKVTSESDVIAIQVKDRGGKLSITTKETCQMLERWASQRNKVSSFQYWSSQVAGNGQNGTTCFVDWISGKGETSVIAKIRTAISEFIKSKDYSFEFPQLLDLLDSQSDFEAYWRSIDWRLGSGGLEEQFLLLTNSIAGLGHNDERSRAFAYIGAIAISSSSKDIAERRWTRDRLIGVTPRDPKYAQVIQVVREIFESKIDVISGKLDGMNKGIRSIQELLESKSGQTNESLESNSSDLGIQASFTGGKNGKALELTVFNKGTVASFLTSWFVVGAAGKEYISLQCESGSLPFRLRGQDQCKFLVSIQGMSFDEISSLGVLDGNNKRHAASTSQVTQIARDAERHQTLFPGPVVDPPGTYAECEFAVEASVVDAIDGKRLAVNVTNKSKLAVPLAGAKIEWSFDPPRKYSAGSSEEPIRSVEELNGSLNLAYRRDLAAPVKADETVIFFVTLEAGGFLLDTLMDDVHPENIACRFGATSGDSWRTTQDEGVAEAVLEFAELVRQRLTPGFVKVEPEWVDDPFGQEIPETGFFADGTNVATGTDYVFSAMRTATWYLPRDSTALHNWEDHWKKLREHLENLVFATRPVECIMIQRRTPGFHLNTLPNIAEQNENNLMGMGPGLGREGSLLYTRSNDPIFTNFPIRDANGKPIENSVGEGFGWKFGFSRLYFEQGSPEFRGENREYPGPSFSELASECSRLLFSLPADIAQSLWQNWAGGFDRRSNSDKYLWYDAIFELAWQGQPGDRLHADRYAPITNGSIGLLGSGIFPRIPKSLFELGKIKVAHEYGHPVQVVSKIDNVVRASVAAIDELLSRGVLQQ